MHCLLVCVDVVRGQQVSSEKGIAVKLVESVPIFCRFQQAVVLLPNPILVLNLLSYNLRLHSRDLDYKYKLKKELHYNSEVLFFIFFESCSLAALPERPRGCLGLFLLSFAWCFRPGSFVCPSRHRKGRRHSSIAY